MPVKSMTGFGRGEVYEGTLKVQVELNAVNRKQFDCTVSLPRDLMSLESKLQALVHTRISRGHVKGFVTVVDSGGAAAVDVGALAAQIVALRSAAKALGLADDLTASSLLRFSDVLLPRLGADDPAAVWPLVERAVLSALECLDAMRRREGQALDQDLRARLAVLEALGGEIAQLAPSVPVAYKAVLEKRLAELLGRGCAADPALVAREVAVFADRCDVSEELTRLSSHFAQVDILINAGSACGRSLDFLCQELFREINTIGSKANDARISRLVIDFKAGLEAVREQVQNIE